MFFRISDLWSRGHRDVDGTTGDNVDADGEDSETLLGFGAFLFLSFDILTGTSKSAPFVLGSATGSSLPAVALLFFEVCLFTGSFTPFDDAFFGCGIINTDIDRNCRN